MANLPSSPHAPCKPSPRESGKPPILLSARLPSRRHAAVNARQARSDPTCRDCIQASAGCNPPKSHCGWRPAPTHNNPISVAVLLLDEFLDDWAILVRRV